MRFIATDRSCDDPRPESVPQIPHPECAPRVRAPPAPRSSFGVSVSLALCIGVFTGVGSAVFRALIGLVYNLSYLGRWSFVLDANLLDPPSPWGNLVFFAPIVGGLIVVFLVRNFAPEAKGHGVPEVMDSIYYKGGDIRGVVAVVKSLASAISIGTGAAVGREGPIIQIGSALGRPWGG